MVLACAKSQPAYGLQDQSEPNVLFHSMYLWAHEFERDSVRVADNQTRAVQRMNARTNQARILPHLVEPAKRLG
jgi:hypothetical protein